MGNDNIITEEMYKKVRGIIRGELAHFNCLDCKRHDIVHYLRDCEIMCGEMMFKPTEKYISTIASVEGLRCTLNKNMNTHSEK